MCVAFIIFLSVLQNQRANIAKCMWFSIYFRFSFELPSSKINMAKARTGFIVLWVTDIRLFMSENVKFVIAVAVFMMSSWKQTFKWQLMINKCQINCKSHQETPALQQKLIEAHNIYLHQMGSFVCVSMSV